jgi:2-keto-3-deoxy-L-rhamnonate aldolase RhmA
VNDVALAMGYPGQPEHPEVTALLEKAIARGAKQYTDLLKQHTA